MVEEIKIKYWSDEMQTVINSVKECFTIVNGELVKMIPEVSMAGTLKYRHKKKVIYYSVLKAKLNVADKIIQDYSPF